MLDILSSPQSLLNKIKPTNPASAVNSYVRLVMNLVNAYIRCLSKDFKEKGDTTYLLMKNVSKLQMTGTEPSSSASTLPTAMR